MRGKTREANTLAISTVQGGRNPLPYLQEVSEEQERCSEIYVVQDDTRAVNVEKSELIMAAALSPGIPLPSSPVHMQQSRGESAEFRDRL